LKKGCRISQSPAAGNTSFFHPLSFIFTRGQPMSLLGEVPATDYRIVVSKSEIRPQAKLYGFSIREKIPTFVLPLQSGDREVILDLQPLLNRIYARARYYLTIDYNQELIPPLKAEDKAWADTLLRELGTLGLGDLKRGKG
jgi:hypothetical protein